MGIDYVTMARNSFNQDSDFIAKARNVYSHLNDEISKKIFEVRSLYALTGDLSYLMNIDPKYRNLSSDIEVYAEKIHKFDHCLIYGAGGAGHYLARRFQIFGVNIDAFIEPDEAKCGIDPQTGIKIISEEELINNRAIYSDKNVVISYSKKDVADSTRRRLIEKAGIPENSIAMGVYDWRNNSSQYFDYFDPLENEVFVDCGCYDGGSCFRFAGWCGQKGYDHIYSFEADPVNYEKCKKVLETLGKCDLYPYGTSKANEKAYFISKGFEDSCIITKEEAEAAGMEGVQTIETVALDDVLKDKRVTFIKFDVEGAEYDALLGAKELIKANRPRMAVSVYHKPEDFVILADLILEMHPDYRISFRHYGLDELETIMYVE